MNNRPYYSVVLLIVGLFAGAQLVSVSQPSQPNAAPLPLAARPLHQSPTKTQEQPSPLYALRHRRAIRSTENGPSLTFADHHSILSAAFQVSSYGAGIEARSCQSLASPAQSDAENATEEFAEFQPLAQSREIGFEPLQEMVRLSFELSRAKEAATNDSHGSSQFISAENEGDSNLLEFSYEASCGLDRNTGKVYAPSEPGDLTVELSLPFEPVTSLPNSHLWLCLVRIWTNWKTDLNYAGRWALIPQISDAMQGEVRRAMLR